MVKKKSKQFEDEMARRYKKGVELGMRIYSECEYALKNDNVSMLEVLGTLKLVEANMVLNIQAMPNKRREAVKEADKDKENKGKMFG